MPLSWTSEWELPGRWTPAPPSEPESTEEEVGDAYPEGRAAALGGTAAEGSDAQVTTPGMAEAEVPESPSPRTGEREQLFPDPWPAYGVLRFSPKEGLRLEAFGPSSDLFAPQTSFALWGETLDGKPCSLVPAWIERERGTLGGHARREVVGGVFALGAHLRSISELEIDRARLRFAGLREFLWHPHRGPLGLAEQGCSDEGEILLGREVAVPGARLTFRLAWEGDRTAHESKRTRTGEVEVVLDEPATFEKWLREWVWPLRDLLVFSLREPSRPEAFIAPFDVTAEPLWWKPDAPPRLETREVELVQQDSLLLLDAPRWRYRRLLFSLGELGDEADSVLATWFTIHRRLEPTARFLFAALNTRLHLENAVLNLTSAAEGYHRAFHEEQRISPERHAELTTEMLAQCATEDEREVYRSRIRHAIEPSQRWRLTRLYRRAAKVIPQRRGAIDAHVDQLIETRNYFVHQHVRHESVRDGDDLSLLLQRLVMVLQANLMLDLRWPTDSAAALLRRSYEGQRVLRTADDERE